MRERAPSSAEFTVAPSQQMCRNSHLTPPYWQIWSTRSRPRVRPSLHLRPEMAPAYSRLSAPGTTPLSTVDTC